MPTKLAVLHAYIQGSTVPQATSGSESLGNLHDLGSSSKDHAQLENLRKTLEACGKKHTCVFIWVFRFVAGGCMGCVA